MMERNINARSANGRCKREAHDHDLPLQLLRIPGVLCRRITDSQDNADGQLSKFI
jgi:hypothetical protein